MAKRTVANASDGIAAEGGGYVRCAGGRCRNCGIVIVVDFSRAGNDAVSPRDAVDRLGAVVCVPRPVGIQGCVLRYLYGRGRGDFRAAVCGRPPAVELPDAAALRRRELAVRRTEGHVFRSRRHACAAVEVERHGVRVRRPVRIVRGIGGNDRVFRNLRAAGRSRPPAAERISWIHRAGKLAYRRRRLYRPGRCVAISAVRVERHWQACAGVTKVNPSTFLS